MKLPKKFKLEKAVSKDPTRQPLHHVFIETNGKKAFAVACAGAAAVRVPIVMDEDDAGGCLPTEAIKEARKLHKNQDDLDFVLSEKVVVENETIRSEYDRFKHLTFPNFAAIFPKSKPKAYICLNVKLLASVAQALGTETVFLEVRESHQPVIVRPNEESDCMGVVAPCAVNRKTNEEKQMEFFEK